MFQMLNLRDEHLDVLGNSSTVQQAIAAVESNIQWMNKNAANITDWLKQRQIISRI
jgi:hypothetical protein